MQPDPYGQQQVMIDPNTGLPSNVIIMQQPSQAPQVVGILVIIYGAISALGSLLGLFGASLLGELATDQTALLEEYSMQLMAFSLVAIILSVGIIISGVWINGRQTRGIHLAWLAIGLSMLMSFIQQMIIPAELSDPSGMSQTFAIVGNVVCTMICGVIVAIPLMVANSGMDQSSLIPK